MDLLLEAVISISKGAGEALNHVSEVLKDWGNWITGTTGLIISQTPSTPRELLVWLSITAVSITILHSMYQFCGWCKELRVKIFGSRHRLHGGESDEN